MGPVPVPGGGDDRVDVGELDLPAELALRLRRVGVEGGRIARAGAGFSITLIFFPVAFSTARITSRLEDGVPVPRL